MVIRAGSGADVITGTFASGGAVNGAFSALGGSGADTIAFTFTAAATAGITMAGADSGVFDGGSGADSITVVNAAVTGGTFDFGVLRGGAGADTITFGGVMGATGGEIANFSGVIDGGAGADSIVLSGNNTYSGGVANFVGNAADGSGGFQFASGDSILEGYDTIFVSNNEVTGGNTMQQGTFGSAGINFSAFNAATFTLAVDATYISAGNADVVTLGQAHYQGSGGVRYSGVGTMTGGFIGAYTAGTDASAGMMGTFIETGGSTLTQIFSAVDAATDSRGTVSVFNVQNGSGGSIDGYIFVQGGIAADQIIKLAGNGATAGAYGAGDGYFSAGGTDALKTAVLTAMDPVARFLRLQRWCWLIPTKSINSCRPERGGFFLLTNDSSI